MRCHFTISIPCDQPVARFKAAFASLPKILGEIQPESVYFGTKDGMRTIFMVKDVKDASDIPAICEPFFLAAGAMVHMVPVMNTEDLMKAGPSIEAAFQTYG